MKNSDHIPQWQILTNIEPEFEADMTREERHEAAMILVAETERLAKQEFDFARENPSPRRAFTWDPLFYICNTLEISRVKLSRYTLEAIGKRAHEITDTIKAANLPEQMKAWVERHFADLKPTLESLFPKVPGGDEDEIFERCLKFVLKRIREERSGCKRISFAIELGYANASRISKACQFAHGIGLGELEERFVRPLVQKFFEEREATTVSRKDAKPQRTEGEGRTGAEQKGGHSDTKVGLTSHDTEVGQTFLSAQAHGAKRTSEAPHSAKVLEAELEQLKAELGLEGDLTEADREILAAILAERVA